MKRSIHNVVLKVWGHSWRYQIVRDESSRALCVSITQRYPSGDIQTLTIPYHHLPAFIAHLRSGMLETTLRMKTKSPTK